MVNLRTRLSWRSTEACGGADLDYVRPQCRHRLRRLRTLASPNPVVQLAGGATARKPSVRPAPTSITSTANAESARTAASACAALSGRDGGIGRCAACDLADRISCERSRRSRRSQRRIGREGAYAATDHIERDSPDRSRSLRRSRRRERPLRLERHGQVPTSMRRWIGTAVGLTQYPKSPSLG